MLSNIILVIFLFVLAPHKYVNSYDWTVTPEKADALFLKGNPYGDRNVHFPEEHSDYAKICNEVTFAAVRPRMLALFAGPILKIEQYRKSARKLYKEKLKNKLCDLAKSKDPKYHKFAKGINADNEKMIPIKDGFIRAMVDASTNTTKLTGGDIVCFFKKWVQETIKCVSTQENKEILAAQTKGYMAIAEHNTASPSCDWHILPSVDHHKFHSIEMLFYEAGKNLAALKAARAQAAKMKITTTMKTQKPTEATESLSEGAEITDLPEI